MSVLSPEADEDEKVPLVRPVEPVEDPAVATAELLPLEPMLEPTEAPTEDPVEPAAPADELVVFEVPPVELAEVALDAPVAVDAAETLDETVVLEVEGDVVPEDPVDCVPAVVPAAAPAPVAVPVAPRVPVVFEGPAPDPARKQPDSDSDNAATASIEGACFIV